MQNLNSTETLATDATDTTEIIPRHINSVDATVGQPMVVRVMARKLELETLLACLPETDRQLGSDMTLALSTISELLSGDLDHVPPVVVVDMNRWIERSKHLGESAVVAPAPNATDALAAW